MIGLHHKRMEKLTTDILGINETLYYSGVLMSLLLMAPIYIYYKNIYIYIYIYAYIGVLKGMELGVD